MKANNNSGSKASAQTNRQNPTGPSIPSDASIGLSKRVSRLTISLIEGNAPRKERKANPFEGVLVVNEIDINLDMDETIRAGKLLREVWLDAICARKSTLGSQSRSAGFGEDEHFHSCVLFHEK